MGVLSRRSFLASPLYILETVVCSHHGTFSILCPPTAVPKSYDHECHPRCLLLSFHDFYNEYFDDDDDVDLEISTTEIPWLL